MKKQSENLISIVVPIYNVEKYLKRCIDSLVNQTYKNLEIILVNDGSTDNSEDIIKTYNDSRIKYFKNENQGIGKTRNFGIEKATGKYIMFIDSDDYIETNMCDLMLKKAIKNKLDMVICNFYCETDDGNKEKVEIEDFGITNLKNTPSLINKINPSPWNKLYVTNIVKNYNIKFIENKKYEDAPFFTNYIKHSKRIALVSECLNHYMIHENSETTIRDRRCFDILDIVDIIRKQYKDVDYMKEEVDKLTVFMITNYTIQQRAVRDKNMADEFIDKAFKYLKEEIPDYKNKKYYNRKGFTRRKIESHKSLTKFYCNMTRWKYIK